MKATVPLVPGLAGGETAGAAPDAAGVAAAELEAGGVAVDGAVDAAAVGVAAAAVGAVVADELHALTSKTPTVRSAAILTR